jgi:hypothetical protein
MTIMIQLWATPNLRDCTVCVSDGSSQPASQSCVVLVAVDQAQFNRQLLDRGLQPVRVDLLAGIVSELDSTFALYSLDLPVELVTVTHFHICNTLVCPGINTLCPFAGISDDQMGLLFTVQYGPFSVPFCLEYPLYRIISLWR